MMQASDNSTEILIQKLDSLQAGLNLIDQGFTLIDEELRIVAWNKPFVDLLGFPISMVYAGAPFESFMRFNAERGEYGHGDVEPLIRARMDLARSFRPHDFVRIRPNGKVLRVHGVPVPGHGFVTLYSDITEQHRQQRQIQDQTMSLEARVRERTLALSETNQEMRKTLAEKDAMSRSLHQSEARLRLITDSIPALIAYFDKDRIYHYVNRGYQEWFGLDTTRPERISAKRFLGLETYAQIKPNIGKALAGSSVSFEYDIKAIDGTTKVARTKLIPEIAPDGSVIGCFELTFDIGDERRSHKVLAQAQKMEAVGQLTGGLAHDFNNILAVILGNLTALAEQQGMEPLFEECLAPAMDAARRGSELISGLLRFSRKQPFEPEVVDANLQMRHVERLVARTMPSTLSLEIETVSTPLMVRMNPNQFQNAILNLILNARDASDSRGRILADCQGHELSPAEALQWHLPAGHYVRVRVRDFGCGMDETTRSRAFEPFYTTKPVGQGSGLGLSMVYGFVRQSAGAIDIESAPGQGTCFSILLPALEAVPIPSQSPDNPSQSTAATQGLCLLVEDDPGVRQLVRRHLLELGYSVLEAENGVEAMDMLERIPDIGALVSDVVMPGGVDGRDVARKALERGDIPKIVLMSGFAPETTSPLSVPLLSKPFTKAELAGALQPLEIKR
ncbi:MAG: PAS-domain containing protein [Proteobacteria bacterium]|nr:PAS-domain containing protein [Pseudomonadota bacterium]